MSEQQFLWNSLDGGENVFIKERGSDKSIHIKIIEGKYEFVDFMKKVNEQQATNSALMTENNHLIDVIKEYAKKYEEQQATIKSKDKQLERLYNYFQYYLKDEMSGNAFSEMWDFVKEDEEWEDE